jgi:hypothetical protein
MTFIPVVAGCGDSITQGTANESGWVDDDGVLEYHVGWGDQATSKALAAYMNLGLYGETVPVSPYTSLAKRETLITRYRPQTIVAMYGANNVLGGTQTAAELLALLEAYWTHLKTTFPWARLLACTVTPRTTSSDSWATPGGQATVATESTRTTLNDGIRASSTPDGVLDSADAVEVNSAGVPTRNGGRWNTSLGAPTIDGLHPNEIAGEMMADGAIRQGYASLIRRAVGTTAVAPSQVTGLAADAGSGQVTLTTWDLPDAGGKPITDYSIQYRVIGAGSWTTFSHAASTLRTATILGLVNGTDYEFRTAAINSVGTGSYSTPVTATPDTSAIAPSSLASNVFWHRAGLGLNTTTPGADITSSDDQSANNNDFDNYSGTAPKYAANVFGTKGAIRFSGATGEQLRHNFGGNPISTAGDWTFIIAMDLKATPPSGCGCWDSQSDRFLGSLDTGSGSMGFYDASSGFHGIAAPVTGKQVLAWRFKASAGTCEMFRNGVSLGSSSGFSAKAMTANFVVGGQFSGGTFPQMDVGDWALFKDDLTDGDLLGVTQYIGDDLEITIG